jgi:hypothetical protein
MPAINPDRLGARRRLLGACWWLTVALGVAGLVLAVLARRDLSKGDFIGGLGEPAAGVYYAALGVLIVRRAANRIGWLMLATGALISADAVAGVYGVIGIRHPGTLPAAPLVGLFAELVFVPLITILITTFLLFPDGGLPSRRWWPAGLAFLVFAVLGMTGLLITPRQMQIPAPGGSLTFPNPLGVASLGPGLVPPAPRDAHRAFRGVPAAARHRGRRAGDPLPQGRPGGAAAGQVAGLRDGGVPRFHAARAGQGSGTEQGGR